MTDKEFQLEYQAAVRRGSIADKTEPRAKAAHYDRRARRIVVDLRSGAQFIFPPELAQRLTDASAAALSNIQLTPSGDGLIWPDLDADFSLPALMAGIFGNKSWMRRIVRGDEISKNSSASRRTSSRIR